MINVFTSTALNKETMGKGLQRVNICQLVQFKLGNKQIYCGLKCLAYITVKYGCNQMAGVHLNTTERPEWNH